MCDKKKSAMGAISLHPLDLDEALEAFMNTPPPENEGNKNRKRKKEEEGDKAEG